MPSKEELKILQALPLEVKKIKTQRRIYEWAEEFSDKGMYISFSGGKDSTVLLNIVREMYPETEAVFVDTGLEYPEIRGFVKGYENVTVLRPRMNFKQVIMKHGYPVISKEVSGKIAEVKRSIELGNFNTIRYRQVMGFEKKEDGKPSWFNCEKYKFLLDAPFRVSNKCCNEMKKVPFNNYERNSGKVPLIGLLAKESRLRQTTWIRYGCNAFDMKRPRSAPMSFWTTNDILKYIFINKLPIASVYGEVIPDEKREVIEQLNLYGHLNDYQECRFKTTGLDRTGCMFCLYGAHLEKDIGRMERMKITHPRQYAYVMDGGEFGEGDMWVPNKEGLGFRFVIDWLNNNGNLHIRY